MLGSARFFQLAHMLASVPGKSHPGFNDKPFRDAVPRALYSLGLAVGHSDGFAFPTMLESHR